MRSKGAQRARGATAGARKVASRLARGTLQKVPTRKSPRPPGLAALAARVALLEERVARLEKGRAAPGDGRAAAVKRPRPVRRCPGCGLPLRQRKGRCLACGRPVASL
jgi:hypothetical protein